MPQAALRGVGSLQCSSRFRRTWVANMTLSRAPQAVPEGRSGNSESLPRYEELKRREAKPEQGRRPSCNGVRLRAEPDPVLR